MLILKNKYLHYSFILTTLCICLLYSIPNLYPDQPCITIQPDSENTTLETLQKLLNSKEFSTKFPQIEQRYDKKALIIAYADVQTQMQAYDFLANNLSEQYKTSLNLLPSTPQWLKQIGIQPMKLGLDLRGGVHLLLQVDTNNAKTEHTKIDLKDILHRLREANIDYDSAKLLDKQSISIYVKNTLMQGKLEKFLKTYYPKHQLETSKEHLILKQTSSSEENKSKYLLQKNIRIS